MAAKINNEIIDKTFDASKLDVEIEGVFMKEKRYALTPLEHKILSISETKMSEWSKRFLLISIGLGLTIISKVIWFLIEFSTATAKEKSKLVLKVESYEIVYLAIGLGMSLIFYLLSCTKFDKNDREVLMTRIKEYFNGDQK